MKYFISILTVLYFSMPNVLRAQEESAIFERISSVITNEDWTSVESLFQEAIELDLEKSESFFWAQLNKKNEASMIMAWKLGFHHKDNRNFDKAHLYFNELYKINSEDIDILCANAELAVLRGQEKKAFELYEKVLQKDSQNLSANIFIGNYYYLQADRQKQKIDKEYKKIKSPTKMQYAGYRNDLTSLMNSDFAKAKVHLEKVIGQFSSMEVKKTLDKIEKVEEECNK